MAEIEDHSDDLIAALEAGIAEGLRAGGELILNASNADSPTLTGTMDNSGTVEVDGTEAGIGYDTEWARKQHENTWYKHPQGDKPKFLENATANNADAVLDVLSQSIGKALGA
jgi:hypothetical protein